MWTGDLEKFFSEFFFGQKHKETTAFRASEYRFFEVPIGVRRKTIGKRHRIRAVYRGDADEGDLL